MNAQHTNGKSPDIITIHINFHILSVLLGALVMYFFSSGSKPAPKADAVMHNVDRAEEDIMDEFNRDIPQYRNFNAVRRLKKDEAA